MLRLSAPTLLPYDDVEPAAADLRVSPTSSVRCGTVKAVVADILLLDFPVNGNRTPVGQQMDSAFQGALLISRAASIYNFAGLLSSVFRRCGVLGRVLW